MLLLAGIWWLTALFWLVHPAFGAQSSSAVRVLKGFAGVLVSLPCWTSFVALHGRGSQGPAFCLALLVMIWLADSGAYFAGTRWGRTRLAPVISPGKTWEGVLGGMVASVAAALVFGYWYSGSLPWTLTLAAVALLAVMFSIVGDLLDLQPVALAGDPVPRAAAHMGGQAIPHQTRGVRSALTYDASCRIVKTSISFPPNEDKPVVLVF